MIVPITDVVKMTLSVADISVEPIIGTPLLNYYADQILYPNVLEKCVRNGISLA